MAKKIISEKSALELFSKICKNEKLVLQNPRSGCFARTDIMCQMAKEASIEPMIIRTSSRDMIKAPLFFTDKDNNIEKTYANWDFHVAMAINVKDSHGNINPLVFDPAMYDGPVTTSQWKNTLGVGEQFRIIPHEEGMAFIRHDYAKANTENADKTMKKVKDNICGINYVKVPSVWAKVAKAKTEKTTIIQTIKNKYINR